MRGVTKAGFDRPVAGVLPSETRHRTVYIRQDRTRYIQMIQKVSWTESNVVITDLRRVEVPVKRVKLLIFDVFPDQNVALQIFHKRDTRKTVISAACNSCNGHSHTHIGELMQTFGGSGSRSGGSCRVEASEADDVLANIIAHLKEWCGEVH